MATPTITSMQHTFDVVNSSIDDYFKANPMSKWVANYQSARDLDYIKAQIDDTQSKINYYKGIFSDVNHKILAFKNQNASEILNVHKINQTLPTLSASQDFYMIFGNGGCLQSNIDLNSTTTKSYLSSVRCDAADPNQKFTIDIFPRIDKSAQYPGVYHLRPNANPHMCLQFNQSGLSVQPCDSTFNKKEQNFAKIDRYVRL